jgi:MFS family permease
VKFFSNSAINRMYMHSGLQSFAFNAGTAFSYVYLLKAGMPVHLVFLTIAFVILLRLLLRKLLVPFVLRIGLRNGLMLGTAIDSTNFLLLGQVNGMDGWFLAYTLFASCGTALYWTCYHASMTRLGDEEHRGAQVSAREAIFAMTGIVAPLFGGFMLTFAGPVYAFLAAFAIYAMAIVPLIGAPDMKLEQDVAVPREARLFAMGLAGSDGLVATAVNFGWRIVLFQSLGENYQNFGGALAIAGLAGAAMGLGVGRLIDLGHHKRSLLIGISAMVCTILAEAFGYTTAWGAVAANMMGAVAGPLYMSSIMAPLYNVGQKSGCAFRFNVAAENGFDLGAGLSALAAALLLWAGFGYLYLILLGLVGCAGVLKMLRFKDQAGL